ncbi:MAG TPA: phenylacetate--CoA ligase family protein [Chloroflexia bacterium]|nr:phenylacetate--CoA ligase family protein [Chloroflexia bacterium]
MEKTTVFPDRDAAAAYGRFFETALGDLASGGLTADMRAQQGAKAALRLFHEAAERVPAYGDFLARSGCDPSAIQTPADFARVPIMDKTNYLRRYPLPDLCWDGDLTALHMISVSSGSTGEPFFWPRGYQQELATAVNFEEIYRYGFAAHTRRTLVVVCFAMGTWIAGTFTTQATALIAQKGYPITLVTPGLNRDEILRAVRELGPHFEQVVLAGYPPFVKDVLDAGHAAGLDWSAFHVKMIWAGEVFSEEWRAHVLEIAGSSDPLRDSAALYGSADAAVLGHEWPLSVAVRRALAARPDLARSIFGEPRLPSLLQYDPRSRYFEVVDCELVFTAPTGTPLIRYNIHDTGGLFTCADLLARCRAAGADPASALGDIASEQVPDLPFVYVFGRSDFTVSFYGANIYPENIKAGLEDPRVRAMLTGKFVMYTTHDSAQRERLAVHVEQVAGLAPAPDLAGRLAPILVEHLRRQNSEFANYVPPEGQLPRVALHAAGDPAWFAPGLKHRYTRPGDPAR